MVRTAWCVAALAALAVLGAALPSAGASSPSPAEPLFQMPLPSPGDAATYAIAAGPGNAGYSQLALRWGAPVAAQDAGFAPHWGLPLWQSVTERNATSTHVQVVDVLTGRVLYGATNVTLPPGATGLPGFGGSVSGERMLYAFFGEQGLCGVSGARHVPAKGAQTARPEFPDCSPAPLASLGPDANGTVTLQDPWGMSLAVRADSPFPLRMSIPLPPSLQGMSKAMGYLHLDLVNQTLAPRWSASSLPPLPQAPARMRLAARPAWGIADDGVQVDFPLQTAWQALASEVSPTSVTLFLATHPRAYVAVASEHRVVDGGGGTHDTWFVLLTDGSDGLGKYATNETGPTGTPGVAVSDDVGFLPGQLNGVYPTPDQAPALLPDAADLVSRFDGLPGMPDRAATGYGFRLYCMGSCASPQLELWAGRDLVRSSAPHPLEGWSGRESAETAQLRFDAQGNGLWWMQDAQLAAAPVPVSPASPVGVQPAGPDAPQAASPVGASAPRGAPGLIVPVAAAAGLLAVVGGVVAVAWKFGPAAITLFSRVEPERVLEHPRRRALWDLIQASPGLHRKEIARRLGMGRGQLEHHLERLERSRLVVRRDAGRYTLYFPRAAGVPDAASASAAAAAGSRSLLRALAGGPSPSAASLASRAGLAPATASYHLRRLRDAGLVQPDRLALTPKGEALVR